MEQLYFSRDMAHKLAHLHERALVMIEAPAGYGKTTAVRWAMRQIPHEQVHWFTAVSFSQDNGLDWFIRQIGQLDPDAAAALHQLGFLNRSNIGAAADILTGLSVEAPSYLILDNFQIIADSWPLALLRAMADRAQDGLHIILISQNFGKLRMVFEHLPGSFFSLPGTFCSAANIFRNTGSSLGWRCPKSRWMSSAAPLRGGPRQ